MLLVMPVSFRFREMSQSCSVTAVTQRELFYVRSLNQTVLMSVSLSTLHHILVVLPCQHSFSVATLLHHAVATVTRTNETYQWGAFKEEGSIIGRGYEKRQLTKALRRQDYTRFFTPR